MTNVRLESKHWLATEVQKIRRSARCGPGMARALPELVADQNQSLQESVERWGAEARRLAESGREVSALDLYRKAADAMPGAPWLQLRTGELARKLRQNEQAIHYLIRAGDAFINAGFPKRAIAPLRSAWSVARQGVPRTLTLFLDVTHKLARLQKQLGFGADASVTFEYANDTLRRLNMDELSEADVLTGESSPGSGPTVAGSPFLAAGGTGRMR